MEIFWNYKNIMLWEIMLQRIMLGEGLLTHIIMHSILLPKQYPFCVFQKRRRFKKVLGCEAECIFVVGIWCCSIRGAQHYHIAYQSCSLMIVPNIRLCTRIGSEYMFMYPIILHSMQISRNFFQKLVELNFCMLPWFQVIPGGRTHHYY